MLSLSVPGEEEAGMGMGEGGLKQNSGRKRERERETKGKKKLLHDTEATNIKGFNVYQLQMSKYILTFVIATHNTRLNTVNEAD